MTKKLTPREKEIRQLGRYLAECEKSIAKAIRYRREVPAYAHRSVKHFRSAIKRMSKQTDEQFAVWQMS
jgi:hypothetical protein